MDARSATDEDGELPPQAVRMLLAMVLVLGTVLAICLFVVQPALDESIHRKMETERYPTYAREAARGCPKIAPRMHEMLADGRVTQDEADVIGTLIDEARAAPGGLSTCRYERWHGLFG